MGRMKLKIRECPVSPTSSSAGPSKIGSGSLNQSPSNNWLSATCLMSDEYKGVVGVSPRCPDPMMQGGVHRRPASGVTVGAYDGAGC